MEIITISQDFESSFLFVIFDNKYLYLFLIIQENNNLKVTKTPFRIELRC